MFLIKLIFSYYRHAFVPILLGKAIDEKDIPYAEKIKENDQKQEE